jgi:tetratricopeptide (TPR) repeat protein
MRPFVVFLAISFLGLTAPFAVGQQQDPASEYLKRGNANLRRGDLAGAIANYDRSLELNPRSAEAHFKRGQVRRAQGNLDEAIDDFELAVEIDPTLVVNRDVADAYYHRGFIKSNGLEMDNAISDFNLAIKFDPSDPNTYVKRGESLLVLNNLKEAVADFDHVIELAANNTVSSIALVDRGYAEMLQGKSKEARNDFSRGLALNPERRFLLELHLRMIEAQARELKRRQEGSELQVAQLQTPRSLRAA